MSTARKGADRLFWFLALTGLIAGLVGLWTRLTVGHASANYGSYIPWGLWVSGYIYMIGLSAGAFVMSALVFVFRVKALERIGTLALLTALTTLIGALLMIWMDLGHMDRVWRMVLRTNFGSVMGWMAWLYGAYFVLLLVEFWQAMRLRLVLQADAPGLAGTLCRILTFGNRDASAASRRRDAARLRILGSIGIPLAIAFHGSVGAIFGVVGARPYWNSGLTPIIFLVGALLSGAALLAMVTAIWGPGKEDGDNTAIVVLIGRIILGLLAFDVILEWAEISIGLWSSLPAESASLKLILFGHYWWVYWGVHVGLGILLPALLLLFAGKRASAVGWAGGLIAATFMSVRLNIVIPGLAVPEMEGLRDAFQGPGLSFEYFPSSAEWLLFIFAVSTAALLFLLGKSLLPVVDHDANPDLEPQLQGGPGHVQ